MTAREGELRPTEWHRAVPVDDGRRVCIVWVSGPCPLERVDVDERDDRVTIGLFERWPPDEVDGIPTAVAAVAVTRSVAVPLERPLGGRPVIDAATGAPFDWRGTPPPDVPDAGSPPTGIRHFGE